MCRATESRPLPDLIPVVIPVVGLLPAGSFSFRSCGAHVLRKIAKSLRALKLDHQLNGFVRFVDLCLNDRVAENVSHRFDGCLGDATIVASMICPLMADTAAKYAALWPAKNSVASKSKRS
jgi:hypothetical protein